jgi:hypothetical protein
MFSKSGKPDVFLEFQGRNTTRAEVAPRGLMVEGAQRRSASFTDHRLHR